jgi:hypothetical protein
LIIPPEMHATKGPYVHPLNRYCAVAVGKFCGVIPYVRNEGTSDVCMCLFGLEADVELASWMLAAFRQQLEHDWAIHKRFHMETKRLLSIKEARLSFVQGFTTAINKRLSDWEFRSIKHSDGTAPSGGDGQLVIRKRNMAEDELASRGMHLGRSSHRGARGNDMAASGAGFNSGSRANVGGQAIGGQRIAIGR